MAGHGEASSPDFKAYPDYRSEYGFGGGAGI
jgi:hypothetical protein